MKKIVYSLFFLFTLNLVAQNQQFNYDFDLTMYTLRDLSIPKDMEGSVKEVSVNTKNKKSTYDIEIKLNEKGKIIERNYNGKHATQIKADYTEDGKTKYYSFVRDNKLQQEKTNIYDSDNRLIESISKSKNGKINYRNTWEFAEGKCPISSSRYGKNGEKLKRSWEHSYYSNCDKSKTILRNAKGKVIKTWSYDCKKEGEQLTKKKDETQVCRWDENDGKYLIKVEQDFDDKGRIRKSVTKYNVADTSIVEYLRYDGKDRLTSKTTYLGSYDKMTSWQLFNKKGKQKYAQFYTYEDENKVKEEFFSKQKISSSKAFTYNEKGLITSSEACNKNGKVTSSSTFEYIY